MAFETYAAGLSSVRDAGRLVRAIQQVNAAALEAQAIWAEYEAGTDSTLVASIEAMFSSGDRTIIDTAVGHLATATNALETHASALLEA